jgi:PAS domain S-box-containing protein
MDPRTVTDHIFPYEKVLFEEVINTADSLIVLSDTDGKIRLFSKKALEITGYRPEEVLGRSWLDMFVPLLITMLFWAAI